MTGGLHLRRGWIRAALTLLALCALSNRFFIPAGFMPESGRIALGICSGAGPAAQVWIDIGKQQHRDDPGESDHAPCTFAGAAMPMVAGAPPEILATAIVYIVTQGLLLEESIGSVEPDRLRPPLRGPPTV